MDRNADPRLQPFDYTLPSDLIARFPPATRDGGRLMDLRGREPVDRDIAQLPLLFEEGDVLVVNDARVLSARLSARRATGGAVEVLALEHEPAGDGTVRAMVRPSRRLRAGETLAVLRGGEVQDALSCQMVAKLPDGSWRVLLQPSPMAVMNQAGEIPLPPYFQRPAEAMDEQRYQTVFAQKMGAVAAPTAGLHLTDSLLTQIRGRGVEVAVVTLMVGAGTFRNLRSEDLDSRTLHVERFDVPVRTVDCIAQTKARGGKVVAVGTTTTRCLESAVGEDGLLQPGPGQTNLFIQPGYRFQVIDRLMTNFHLPRSSLLMLVSAFGGRERVMAAYQHAIEANYRFYSYGDAMLIDPVEALS